MRFLQRGTLVVAVVALVGACAAPETDNDQQNTEATAPDDEDAASGDDTDTGTETADGGPIPIGVNIELSGAAAVQGEAYENAVTLLAEQINAEGVLDGQEIELIIRDNRSDPTEALQIANGLVDNEDAVAMIGGGSSPTTLSLVDYAEEAGLPTVSMGSSTAIVTPVEDRQYLFKTPANTEQILDVMLERFEQTGVTSMGLLAVDNPYGEAGIQAVEAAADSGRIELTGIETFPGEARDYTAQVTNLINDQPDAIVVWAIPPGAGIAAQNLADAGYDGERYFDAGAGAELFLRGAGNAADNVFMVHPTVLAAPQAPADLPNHEVMTGFYEAYTEQYGEFSGFASYAADALQLIVHAIEEAGTTDRAAVRDAMETLEYTGITGVYQMSEDNHAGLTTESLSVITVQDGDWELEQ